MSTNGINSASRNHHPGAEVLCKIVLCVEVNHVRSAVAGCTGNDATAGIEREPGWQPYRREVQRPHADGWNSI